MKFKNNSEIEKKSTCSPSKVMGYGEIELEENEKSQVSTFDIEYLMNALESLKLIGIEYVDVRVQTDFPMFLSGDSDLKHEKTLGLLLAPRTLD